MRSLPISWVVCFVSSISVSKGFAPMRVILKPRFDILELGLSRIDYEVELSRRQLASISAMGLVTLALPSSVVQAADNKKVIPEWTLEGGVKMPTLALNTVGLSIDDTERAVTLSRQEGISHIDFHPGKERDGVAKYMRAHGREGLFLNTKIRKAPPGTSAEDAAKRTRDQIDEDLKALGVESVDMLMLRDSPDCDVIQAQWGVLE